MSDKIREIQGYAIVVDKILFVTRVFEAEGEEGFQFNIAFTGEKRLAPRFSTRHEAELEREMLLKAIREA
ncbi:hypothetical protein [Elongatibacter sediminis]|uniref:Uncharacterized protein n=1 Tax=Elongatibacter sediminis TaxID=3119006 RepID=A0AAW9RPM1_9GAMM